jgi:hypothetical protein
VLGEEVTGWAVVVGVAGLEGVLSEVAGSHCPVTDGDDARAVVGMGLAIGWPSPGARCMGGAMMTAPDNGLGELWLGRESGVVLCESGDGFLLPGARASHTAGDSISSSTVTLGSIVGSPPH